MRANFFCEENGAYSMRRLLAFIFAIAFIGITVCNVILGRSWRLTAVSSSLPLAGSLLMMFFTSWEDVTNIVNAVRK